jgi:hypothetical protein
MNLHLIQVKSVKFHFIQHIGLNLYSVQHKALLIDFIYFFQREGMKINSFISGK